MPIPFNFLSAAFFYVFGAALFDRKVFFPSGTDGDVRDERRKQDKKKNQKNLTIATSALVLVSRTLFE